MTLTHDDSKFPHVTATTQLPCPTWCESGANHPLTVEPGRALPDDLDARPVPQRWRLEAGSTHWRPLTYTREHVAVLTASGPHAVTVTQQETALTPYGPTESGPALAVSLYVTDDLTGDQARGVARALLRAADLYDSAMTELAGPGR